MSLSPVYLDCNATTPIDPAVIEVLRRYLEQEYGNEGSRTHEFGARAKQAVQHARDQVASVVRARRDEVIFTSGATESNNLALLGLSDYGESEGRRHIISTRIEHKAVLEPIEYLEGRGFEVTWLESDSHGRINAAEVATALRPDTLLVSIMAANNETGVRQPLTEICESMKGHAAYLHTDGAQAFGKDIDLLRHERLDLISISGHKLHGPKGIGALVVRRRGYKKIPLKPLVLGGGQERGLRPGTLPVAMVAALGKAAEIAVKENEKRIQACSKIKEQAMAALKPLGIRLHGKAEHTMDHVLNFAVPGIDSEGLIVALKDLVAISNGSACTSSSYTPSHVLKAMGYSDDEANEAIRLSWCHMTPDVDWAKIADRISSLR